MVASRDADVVVVGMGPGGEQVAGSLASAGMSVVGIEANLLGGECPYWACVPSKMMLRAAGLLGEGRRIPGMAGESAIVPGWRPLAQRIRDDATSDWDDKAAVERFAGLGGRFVRGRARVTGPHEVRVGDEEFRASRALVLATGTRPSIPPVTGLDVTPYWTNHEAIEAAAVPDTLLVLGGGTTGVELAQVFARFGARVTLVERAPRLLPMEEPEVDAPLRESLAEDGVSVRTGVSVSSVDYDQTFRVNFEDGAYADAERLLVATGREAALSELGVGELAVDEGSAFLPVDESLRLAPGVWAVGDVTGRGLFTHVALYQADIAVRDIAGDSGKRRRGADHRADYRAVPRATLTDPEIGGVGLTEAQAREAGLRVRTSVTGLGARGWIHKAGGQGLVKLVTDADRGVLVGATCAGPAGGEVLGMLTLAVHREVPVEELGRMIYAYPTFHRAVRDALAELS